MAQQTMFNKQHEELDVEQATCQTIDTINQWLQQQKIEQTEIQKEMMLSHIKAMVQRAQSGESLPEVDPELFTELSDQAMLLAKKTVALFNTLADEEAYLLAVHYEVAMANQIKS